MVTRRFIPTLASAVLLSAGLSGCGSGAGTSSSAAQSGPSTGATALSAPGTTTAATSAPTVSSSDTLVSATISDSLGTAAYLKSLTPLRLQLARVHTSTSAMAAALDAGDAPTAGRNASAAAAGVRRALAIARRIRPDDEPLATVHTQLLANLRIGVAYLTRMARDLNAVDVDAIHSWGTTVMPQIRKSERWYAEWATNVAALATLDGVKPPHWLHTMNRWN